MKNENKVILIKGNGSNWYEQAIFIIKQSTPQNKIPLDCVTEAENIIKNYMQGLHSEKSQKHRIKVKVRNINILKKNKNWNTLLNISIVTSSLILLVVLIFYFK